jgi:hypothetical protein
MTYKEQLLQDLQEHQKRIEITKKNLEWAKANLEYEKAHIKRQRLSLMWVKVRIYSHDAGYNEISEKQNKWCDKIWNIYTEQIDKALEKMNEETAK